MKFIAKTSIPSTIKQFVVFAEKGKSVSAPDSAFSAAIKDALKHKQFSGDEGELLPLVQGDKTLILAGCGDKAADVNLRKAATLVKQALLAKPLTPQKPVAVVPLKDNEPWVRAIVDGAGIGLYRWDKYQKKPKDAPDYSKLSLTIKTKNAALVKQLATIIDGATLTRDLGNENADIAHSSFIESKIRSLVKGNKNCKMEVLNRAQLKAKGLNLHLAVNQGSDKDPKLIIVTYSGGKKSDPYVALVGKGITFDTGGLNLKPTGSMEDMRFDMCGAAAVTGALANTLALKIQVNAYFVVGLAENAIGPRAYKPGDVFKSYSGKTVEILNTDAEGRLVLADANSYIAKNYKPSDGIINIATLTGAVIIALGNDHAGLMSTHDDLAGKLLKAAEATDDRAWRMPIYSELKDHVKSQIADIKNIGLKRTAGTVSAGEFLRQFAQFEDESLPWAHLDVAGTAMLDSDLAYFAPGASSAGVRLLTRYLLDRAGA